MSESDNWASVMKRKSKGAFMRWWRFREVSWYSRAHGGEGRDYRSHPVSQLFPVISKGGQLEFEF